MKWWVPGLVFAALSLEPRRTVSGVDYKTMVLPSTLLDRREFQLVQLSNGMDILIGRDTSYAKSQVVLDLQAGLRDDPPTRHGLAHLVEHALITSDFKAVSGFGTD